MDESGITLDMDTNEDVSQPEISINVEPNITEGCKLPVFMTDDKPPVMAEIVQIRTNKEGINQYYVHYLDFNKRLDQWVTEKRLDLSQGINIIDLIIVLFMCVVT